MTAKKWSEIRAKKFSPDDLRQIDQEVENELVELDLRALREATDKPGPQVATGSSGTGGCGGLGPRRT